MHRNQILIQQVNENQQSKNHESMVSNIALIQEIKNNVSKIVGIYAELLVIFRVCLIKGRRVMG
ncbi:putative protein EARLY FLOWERING 4 [Helianthus annuus]|nr:putative protein EARLY FLOWERING 4 [Helianthus annuus]KAJ0667310.1 putative protein EARLY FLOWERING 4 [Helianthus annuus]